MDAPQRTANRKPPIIARPLHAFIIALTATALSCIVFFVARNTDQYQWDFKVYYTATAAVSAGLNPYSLEDLSRQAGHSITLPFVYTPLSLYFFRLFTLFDYQTAYHLFWVMKVALILLLIATWKMLLFEKEMDLIFLPFCFFAFNCALLLDLLAGNISIIEQVFIWLAFLSLYRNKPGLFCVLILLAASIKLSPILLSTALLFSSSRNRCAYWIALCSAFVLIQVLTFLASPILYKDFLSIVSLLEERGANNPSTLALIKDGIGWISSLMELTLPDTTALVVFLLWISFVFYVSIKHIIRFEPNDKTTKEQILTFFICVVYAVILPRFKNYSYILLIPPAYYLIKQYAQFKDFAFLYMLMILPVPDILSCVFPNNEASRLAHFSLIIGGYYSLIIAYAMWYLYLRRLERPPNATIDVDP